MEIEIVATLDDESNAATPLVQSAHTAGTGIEESETNVCN